VCEGFAAVEVPPSPNDQDREVRLPVERSVKATVRGAFPVVGVPENCATGAAGDTTFRLTGIVCGELVAPEAVTVIVAE
jgi:hypothetical protein